MIGQALHCISSRLKERFKRDVLRSLVNCPKRRRSSGRINPFQTNTLVSFNTPPCPAPSLHFKPRDFRQGSLALCRG